MGWEMNAARLTYREIIIIGCIINVIARPLLSSNDNSAFFGPLNASSDTKMGNRERAGRSQIPGQTLCQKSVLNINPKG